MLETQFPSSPLEDEGLSEDAIRSMSQLIHTTSMVAAKAIITSGQIGGVGFDPDRQASFGTIRCPKVRLARYQEVSLHFYWHGSHQAIHESRAWNSATWPSLPDPDVAYHLKIDEQLGNGGLYWQTNIYSSTSKLEFVKAELVTSVSPKLGVLAERTPQLLLSRLDPDYFHYKEKLKEVEHLNGYQGKIIGVRSDLRHVAARLELAGA